MQNLFEWMEVLQAFPTKYAAIRTLVRSSEVVKMRNENMTLLSEQWQVSEIILKNTSSLSWKPVKANIQLGTSPVFSRRTVFSACYGKQQLFPSVEGMKIPNAVNDFHQKTNSKIHHQSHQLHKTRGIFGI